MKNLYLLLLALLVLCILTQAQPRPVPIQPLKVGDTLPPVTVSHVLHHPDGELQLSAFRDRWLILEFWVPWCSVCIGMVPRIDSLQQAFAGQVQFLKVTYEDASTVQHLFSRLDRLRGLAPLIATGDSMLRHMFPHRSLPHYVWVSPGGRVVAITGREQLTAEGLQAAFSQRHVQLPVKQDAPRTFTRHDHLLQLHPAAEQGFRSASILTGYVEGAGSFRYTPGPGHILAMNQSLQSLYALAYSGRGTYFGRNRTFLEVAEPSHLTARSSGRSATTWLRQGGAHSYEALVSADNPADAYELLQADLASHFPQYTATLEVRSLPILALVRTSAVDKLRASGSQRPAASIKPYGATLTNSPLSALVSVLQVKYLQHLPTPFIDETGYTAPVDLSLDADLDQVETLRKALQAYDLDIVSKVAPIKVLIIRDVTTPSNDF